MEESEIRQLVPEDKFARTIETVRKISYPELMRFKIGLDGASTAGAWQWRLRRRHCFGAEKDRCCSRPMVFIERNWKRRGKRARRPV